MMARGPLLLVIFAMVVSSAACTAQDSELPPTPTAPPLTDPPSTATGSTATSTGPTTTTTSATSSVVPPTTSVTTTTGLPTTVPSPGVVALPNVFGQEGSTAVTELQELGFGVIFYDVCSGSVARGEVRQVVDPEETELVGTNGVTEAGLEVPFGSTIEVKIGTGSAC